MNYIGTRKKRSGEIDSYVKQISGNIVEKEKIIEFGQTLCAARIAFRLEALSKTEILDKVQSLFSLLSSKKVRWDYVFELSMKQSERVKELQRSLPAYVELVDRSLTSPHEIRQELSREIESTGIRTVHICRWHAEALQFCNESSADDFDRENESYTRFINAKHMLARTGLMFVVKIAHQFRNTESSLMERIQDGNVGVMIAAEKYNPALGWTFTSYASHWIKQCILIGIRQREFIRLPVQQTSRLRSCKTDLVDYSQQLRRKMSPHEQAEFLDQSVGETLYRASFQSAISLQQLPGLEDGTFPADDMDRKCSMCPQALLEQEETRMAIASAVNDLEPSARQVLELRFGLNDETEHSVACIGRRLGLSHYRVQQIISKAFAKLQPQLAGFE